MTDRRSPNLHRQPEDDGWSNAAGDSVDQALRRAAAVMEHGNYPGARELAQSALIAARATGDLSLEAEALSCLAQCDSMAHRLRRAAETARRAVQLFQRVGDVASETVALNTLSHASRLLGRNDESIEAALLSVALSDANAPTVTTVMAHTCLGMAHCWSGQFERASAALETAIHLAARCTPQLSPYQPKLNQLWVEAARLADERYQTGAIGSLVQMGVLVRECRGLERSRMQLHALPGSVSTATTLSAALKGVFAAWRGELHSARIYADRAIGSLSGTVTWVDAVARWVVAELAWAAGDWSGAEVALVEMRSCAIAAEHEQLACLSQLLLVQVFELQGKHRAASEEMRALRARERRIVAESLRGRETAVRWQLGARQSERHLEQALEVSKQFERWSFEDALTGMANRRAFEQALAERLPASVADGRPLTVAMVDVDRFKSVNDTYSHQIGDRVLQSIGSVLMASIRGNDLAARLAGDEFVVLFSNADEAMAGEICERIGAAIAGFEWDRLARGLHVTVSIGVSQAIAGDTVESIVHRSDKSMYSGKRGWAPTTLPELTG